MESYWFGRLPATWESKNDRAWKSVCEGERVMNGSE